MTAAVASSNERHGILRDKNQALREKAIRILFATTVVLGVVRVDPEKAGTRLCSFAAKRDWRHSEAPDSDVDADCMDEFRLECPPTTRKRSES